MTAVNEVLISTPEGLARHPLTNPVTPARSPAVGVPPFVPSELRLIPLAQLVESPWNPRKHFDPAKLAEMAESLRKGQLAPIIVRAIAGKRERYEIGAGHRRFRSAPAAGMTSLLAIVRDLDDVAFLELLTIENKQREDVAPLDEANGFRLLMEKAAYDVGKLAARIGLSTKYVYDRLKLLQLVPAAKKLLEDGRITAGHAILIARLSPADQKRTIGDEDQISDSWRGVSGGLFESEDAEGLGLDDAVKPRSVRELEQWIRDNVRATPERVDPFLFPASAATLEAAKEEKLDVIHITREYRVADEARDEKTRTFGSQAWKRADGKPEEDAYTGHSVKSKPCDFSRYGFVVAGPGQGEVFKVCVNKKKCATHWPDQVKAEKERAQREKSRAKARAKGGDAEAKALARQETADRKREAEQAREGLVSAAAEKLIKERAPQWALAVNALAKQIKLPAEFASWMARDRMLDPELENVIQYGELDDVKDPQSLFNAMRPKLDGGWSRGGTPETAAAQPVALALLFWLSNNAAKIEADVTREAEKIVEADQSAAKTKSEKKQTRSKKAGKAKR